MSCIYQTCPHCGRQSVPTETLKAVLRSAAVVYGYLKGLQHEAALSAETISQCEQHGSELLDLYQEAHK